MKVLAAISSLIVLSSVSFHKLETITDLPEYPRFSSEAHRGGRGLMPENTISAMLNTLRNYPATTLEMDTHITKDGEVVVTHDDYLNRNFTLLPNGDEIPKEDAKKYAIYGMNYDVLKSFIVGSRLYPAFPDQQKVKSYIPRLGDLIDSVQHFIKTNGKKQCFYDIEIKSTVKGDDVFHPRPEKFADLVVAVLMQKGILNYVIIQSFDKRVLKYIHQKYPEIRLNCLANNDKSYEEHIAELGFKPFIVGSSYKGFKPEIIAKAHADGVKVLTATVNSKEEIDKLKALGIDGVMTDYPNLF